MAKIPLRAYLKEIEGMINRGENDQAIAHAKNILKSYPKHLDTYRLLGQAYLESHRFTEASDVFQRVLAVFPDDFIAHGSLSIIREDENNLEDAIAHMERAYEVQPFNPGVQAELRRLYGKRDGVEPHKIRLTRGALIRMYSRGGLYPQAIAENRAALADDPQRLDLQAMLARLYLDAGQKLEAAEEASALLSKLPFCFEANRILAEVLPGTSRAEDAKKFQQVIYAIDPYQAFLTPSAPTGELVADQAVLVERFAWDAEVDAGTQAPDWARNVGVAWEETEEDLPDWLDTLAAPAAPAAAEPAASSADEFMPDFLKEAGWTPADRPADEIMAEAEAQEGPFHAETELSGAVEDAGDIEPGELPDWIQSIAPPAAGTLAAMDEPAEPAFPDLTEAPGENQERDAWLSSLLSEPAADSAAAGLEGLAAPAESSAAAVEPQAAGSGELPPAEADLGAQMDANLPDWLSEADLEAPAAAVPPAAEPPAATQDQEDLPDWLKIDAETGQPAPSLWTGESEAVQPADEQPPADETPDWLKGFGAEVPASSQTPEQPTDIDWLVAAEGGETIETAMEASTEAASDEDLPDWLNEFSAGVDIGTPPEPVEAQVPGGETAHLEPSQPEAAAPDFSAMEDDDALAWMEALAAKQGADEATLITRPEDRLETPPDWIAEQVEQTGAQPYEIPAAETPSAAAPESAVEPGSTSDMMIEPETFTGARAYPVESAAAFSGWIKEEELESTAPISEQPAQEPAGQAEAEASAAVDLPPAEQLPVAEQLPAAEQPPVAEQPLAADQPEAEAATSGFDSMDDEDTMAWLESLAARQGADEATLITPPGQRTETPPEWVQKAAYGELSVEDELVAQPPAAVEEDVPSTAPVELAEAQPSEPQAESLSQEAQAAVQKLAEEEEQLPDWVKDLVGLDTELAEPETGLAAQPPAEPLPASSELGWIPEEVSEFEEPEDARELEETAALEPPAEPEAWQPPASLAEESEAPASPGEQVAAAADAGGEEMDLDFAWLESLAARQGVQDGTLITSPEERVETPPDWVQAASAEAEEEVPEWLASLETGEEPQAEVPAEWSTSSDTSTAEAQMEEVQPESISPAAPLQDEISAGETPSGEWAGYEAEEAGITEEPASSEPAAEELPDWLRQVERDEAGQAAAAGTESVPAWLSEMEDQSELEQPHVAEAYLPEEVMPDSELPAAPVDFQSIWTTEEAAERAGEGNESDRQELSGPSGWSRSPVESGEITSLAEAQNALLHGQVDTALQVYNRFIRSGEHLDQSIVDLRDALYRYPVNTDIWMALGDAYTRSDKIQEALDAYTKAEELLR